MGKPWTEEEIEFVKKNPDMTSREIAKKLGRTQKAIYQKRFALDIPTERWQGSKLPETISQSEKEMRIIRMATQMRVRLLGKERR